MYRRNLIHPMTAGDLVESACVLAIRERGMGAATETTIWECMRVRQTAVTDIVDVDFRDRQTNDRFTLTLRKTTPLLFTRISL